jgi:glycosyltransferase involved in cell wall biosynthesis
MEIKKKIISYNATCFNTNFSGANQRFFTLYRDLIKSLPNYQFIIYEPYDYSFKNIFKNNKNITFIKSRIKNDSSRLVKAINFLLYKKFFFSENFNLGEVFNLPFLNNKNKNIIFTIHDLRYHYFYKSSLTSYIYRFIFYLCVKNINNIIVVSNSMKEQVQKLFPQKKITVIPNNVELNKFKYDNVHTKNVLKKFNIKNKYLLSIGHIEERKNYINLLKAFAIFSKKHIDCSLIIVGFVGQKNIRDKLITYIKINNLSSKVLLLDDVNETEKIILYKQAELFIFPSKYEGFGIPILEAMSLRCPLVLSDIPVFKEITENKLFYFDPYKPLAIAKVLSSVFLSKTKRKFCISYGLNRVKDFSIEKNKKKLLDLYAETL